MQNLIINGVDFTQLAKDVQEIKTFLLSNSVPEKQMQQIEKESELRMSADII